MILVVLPDGGCLADLKHPAEMRVGGGRAGEGAGEVGDETVEDRKTTDLPVVRE